MPLPRTRSIPNKLGPTFLPETANLRLCMYSSAGTEFCSDNECTKSSIVNILIN